MTHLFAILTIVFSSWNFSPAEVGGSDKNSIEWEPNYKLTWNDFKATPDRSSQFAALTRWKIGYNFEYREGKGHLDVYANFIKTKSWVKSNSKKDNILAHEQLHFDIAELNARKLRKTWSQYEINYKTLQRDVDRMFNKAWDTTVEMQEDYDKESDHGTIKNKQAAWEKYVAEELIKYEKYQR